MSATTWDVVPLCTARDSTSNEESSAVADRPKRWRVFVDGACPGNQRAQHRRSAAGCGAFLEDSTWTLSAPLEPPFTNNRAELMAVIVVLEDVIAGKTPVLCARGDSLVVLGDNQYVLRCACEWMAKWKANGFRTAAGGEVKNPDLLARLDGAMSVFRAKKWPLRFEWVRGHTKEPATKHSLEWRNWFGNKEADRLACAASKPRPASKPCPASNCSNETLSLKKESVEKDTNGKRAKY